MSEIKLFNKFLAFQISFPLIGGFLFGYNTGVISGALLLLKTEFPVLSVFYQEIIVSAALIAAVVGALLAGFLSESIGRKPTILLSSILMMLGSLVMGIAEQPPMVIVGRSIGGLGIGVASTSCPIYISEVAPKEIRGRLIVLYQIMIAGGQFIATIVNALFVEFHSWRYMLGFAAIPAFVQAMGLIFIPESHRWLLSKDRLQKAKKVIRKEHRVQEELIDDYIDEILLSNEHMLQSLKDRKLEHSNIILQILRDSTARNLLLMGCGIQIIGQIVGINGVIYYSSQIIATTGITKHQTLLWCTSLVMFFCFAPVLFAYFLIDRIGRRKLAMLSLMGTFIGSAILASGFLVMYYESQLVTERWPMNRLDDCYKRINCEACVTIHTCGFCSVNNSEATYCLSVSPSQINRSLDGPCSVSFFQQNISNSHFQVGNCASSYSWIVLLGIVVYLFSYAIGMGPVPWVVTSEVYPLWCRGVCMAISTAIIWTFNIAISMTFLSLTELITRFGAFWLFAGISVCSLAIFYKWLPETTDISLEEVPLLVEPE